MRDTGRIGCIACPGADVANTDTWLPQTFLQYCTYRFSVLTAGAEWDIQRLVQCSRPTFISSSKKLNGFYSELKVSLLSFRAALSIRASNCYWSDHTCFSGGSCGPPTLKKYIYLRYGGTVSIRRWIRLCIVQFLSFRISCYLICLQLVEDRAAESTITN
jgi:hypothetical protein